MEFPPPPTSCKEWLKVIQEQEQNPEQNPEKKEELFLRMKMACQAEIDYKQCILLSDLSKMLK